MGQQDATNLGPGEALSNGCYSITCELEKMFIYLYTFKFNCPADDSIFSWVSLEVVGLYISLIAFP